MLRTRWVSRHRSTSVYCRPHFRVSQKSRIACWVSRSSRRWFSERNKRAKSFIAQTITVHWLVSPFELDHPTGNNILRVFPEFLYRLQQAMRSVFAVAKCPAMFILPAAKYGVRHDPNGRYVARFSEILLCAERFGQQKSIAGRFEQAKRVDCATDLHRVSIFRSRRESITFSNIARTWPHSCCSFKCAVTIERASVINWFAYWTILPVYRTRRNESTRICTSWVPMRAIDGHTSAHGFCIIACVRCQFTSSRDWSLSSTASTNTSTFSGKLTVRCQVSLSRLSEKHYIHAIYRYLSDFLYNWIISTLRRAECLADQAKAVSTKSKKPKPNKKAMKLYCRETLLSQALKCMFCGYYNVRVMDMEKGRDSKL